MRVSMRTIVSVAIGAALSMMAVAGKDPRGETPSDSKNKNKKIQKVGGQRQSGDPNTKQSGTKGTTPPTR